MQQPSILARPDGATIAYHHNSGKGPGVLSIHAVASGEQLAESALPAPPIFDGMAAADGKLYVALKNGELICLGE